MEDKKTVGVFIIGTVNDIVKVQRYAKLMHDYDVSVLHQINDDVRHEPSIWPAEAIEQIANYRLSSRRGEAVTALCSAAGIEVSKRMVELLKLNPADGILHNMKRMEELGIDLTMEDPYVGLQREYDKRLIDSKHEEPFEDLSTHDPHDRLNFGAKRQQKTRATPQRWEQRMKKKAKNHKKRRR